MDLTRGFTKGFLLCDSFDFWNFQLLLSEAEIRDLLVGSVDFQFVILDDHFLKLYLVETSKHVNFHSK